MGRNLRNPNRIRNIVFCLAMIALLVLSAGCFVMSDEDSSAAIVEKSTSSIKYHVDDVNLTAEIYEYIGTENNVTIPATVTFDDVVYVVDSIEKNNLMTFKVENIFVDEASTYFKDIDGVLFNYDCTTLVCYPSNHGEEQPEYTVPDGVTTIGAQSFKGVQYLETLNADNVLTIENSAFYRVVSNDTLKSVSLSSITTIGDYVFYRNTGLEEVVLSDSLTSIGMEAFMECISLKSIQLPGSLLSIDHSAFSNSGIESVFISSNITEIPYNTFYGCSHLLTIEFETPSSLTTIGNDAFRYCTSLTAFQLPASVTSVGSNAFDGVCGAPASPTGGSIIGHDYNLSVTWTPGTDSYTAVLMCDNDNEHIINAEDGLETELRMISNNLSVVGTYNGLEYVSQVDTINPWAIGDIYVAINGSIGEITGLTDNDTTSLFIPSTLFEGLISVVVTDNSFMSATSIVDITTNGDDYVVVDGVLFSADMETLILYPMDSDATSYVIPDEVLYIHPYAFNGAVNLEQITLPDGLLTIGEQSFCNCTSLESITIHSGLTVGSDAFMDCTSLTRLFLADGVTLNNDAFSTNSILKVYLPNVSSPVVNLNAFQNNVRLVYNDLIYTYYNTLEVPMRLQVSGCISANESITIPDTVLGREVAAIANFSGSDTIETVTIDSDIKFILDNAFIGCDSLTSVIATGVTAIGANAFKGCVSLQNVSIDNILSIDDNAFYGCISLTNFVIPLSLVITGDNAFEGVPGVEPNSYPSPGNMIGIITTADGWTFIPNNDYSTARVSKYNGDGDNVTIPEFAAPDNPNYKFTITSIDAGAFAHAEKMEIITINRNITSIDSTAFDGCSTLKSIEVDANNETYSSRLSCLFTLDKHTLLRCPEGYALSDDGRFSLPYSDINHIGSSAFKGCVNIDEVVVYYIIDAQTDSFKDGMRLSYIDNNFSYVYLFNEGTVTMMEANTSYVNIPATILTNIPVADISAAVFDYSHYSYQVDENNLYFASVDGVLYNYGVTILIDYPKYSTLSEYNMPDSVISIRDGAFDGANLYSFVVGNGNAAYASHEGVLYNKELTHMVMYPGNSSTRKYVAPDTVVSIEAGALYNCYYLDNVEFSDTISVEANTFKNSLFVKMGKITYYVENQKLSVYDCDEDAVNVTIPATLGGGYDVVKIGRSAFGDCESLLSIIIPANVTSIENYAFSNCTSLSSVTFETTVLVSIGSQAFYNCSSITELTLPDSVETIDNYAFYQCTSLTTIHLSDSLESIGSNSFCYCSSLESITIPAGVTEIKNSTFMYCSSLTSITILSDLTIIGDQSFYECESLLSFDIPSTVTSIGYSAFYQCSKLTEIVIPAGVEVIGEYTFYHCSSLESVTLPASLLEIKEYAFEACAFESVSLPDSSTSIGNYAFYGCEKLSFITIPANMEEIGDYAFFNCVLLESVTFAGTKVTAIGNNAFRDCDKLTSFSITSTELSIGSYAFAYCDNLESINISCSGTVSIDEYAFYGCSALESLSLPEGLTAISKGLFCSCGKLTTVNIPDNVTTIGDEAFYYCRALESIDFPENVTSIGNSAFRACNNLESISLPEGLTALNDYLFYECYELKTVELPSTVTTIGTSVFHYCRELESINLPQNLTSIGFAAFTGCDSLESVTLSEGLLTIGDSAFSGCKKLTTISIPSTVTHIGTGAFKECISLVEFVVIENDVYESKDGVLFSKAGVLMTYPHLKEGLSYVVPEGTTRIGEYAFYLNETLTSIVISEGVTTIGEYAFYIASLVSVSLPESLTSIENRAFSYCSSLASFTVPDVTIGENAFYNVCGVDGTPSPGDVIGHSYHAVSVGFIYNTENLTMTLFCDHCSRYKYDVPSSLEMVDGELLVVAIYGTEEHRHEFTLTSLERDDFRFILDIENRTASINYCYLPDTITTVEVPETILSGFFTVTSISSIFNGYSSLTSVTLPDTIESIGNSAFNYCTSLERFVCPASLTTIGQYAFYYCTALEEIVFSENLTSIDYDAFYQCSKLTSVELPASLTTTGTHVFSNCTSLTTVTIPGSLKTIQSSMFSNCTSLSSLTIAEGVETIAGYAFNSCTSLMNISLPQSILSIASNAFNGTTSSEEGPWTTIYLPTYDCEIYNYAFSNYSRIVCGPLTYECRNNVLKVIGCDDSVTEVTIPAYIGLTVTTIDAHAFDGCSLLTTINVNVTNYSSSDGVLIYQGNEIVKYPEGKSGESYVALENIKYISEGAFKGCSLSSVMFQYNDITIRGDAFDDGVVLMDGILSYLLSEMEVEIIDCSPDATKVYIYDKFGKLYPITKVSDDAFDNASLLERFILINSTHFNVYYNMLFNADYSILIRCPMKVTTPTIHASTTTINVNAFNGCSLLTKIDVATGNTIYSSVNGILFDASRQTLILCPAGYVGVCVIPDTVNEIAAGAFPDGVEISQNNMSFLVTDGSLTLLVCNASESVLEIPLALGPYDITDISPSAFDGLEDLTAFSVPSESNFTVIDGVLFDKDVKELIRFPQGMDVESYIVPPSVEHIGDNAFSGCDQLYYVELSNVQSIGSSSFSGCSSLSMSLPQGVVAEEDAFEGMFVSDDGSGAVGHVIVATFNWSDNDTKCVVTLTCVGHPEHVFDDIDAVVTEKDGMHEAVAEYHGRLFVDTKEISQSSSGSNALLIGAGVVVAIVAVAGVFLFIRRQ